MTQPRILIVGAGIAGLVLARRLEQLDMPFTIVERRDGKSHGGAGIALPFNALEGFEQLEIRDAIMAVAHPVQEVIYARADGRILCRADLTKPPLGRAPFVALRREALHAVLLEGLQTTIHYDVALTGVQPRDSSTHVTCTDETWSGDYDLVVAADGLHSSVRKALYPRDPITQYGITTYRWLVDWPNHGLQPTYSMGQTDMGMLYPLSSTEVYAYAHVHEDQFMPQGDDPGADLLRFLRGYDETMRHAVEAAQTATVIRGPAQTLDDAFFFKGRVAFVGDAAHACAPMLQQGAAAAIEDCLSLTAALSGSDVPAALEAYRRKREPRVRWVQQKSNMPYAMISKMRSVPMRMIRNGMLRLGGPVNAAGWRKLATMASIAPD